MSQGVDVIFQNADNAGLGVFQAAREKKGALVVGSNSNQNDVAPEVILGSVAIDLPLAFLTVAKQVEDGTFKPGVIKLGEASHVVTFIENPKLQGTIPVAARAKIDSLQTQMLAGTYSIASKVDSTAAPR
jgi:basic membrane lipoprotein Med (substrate-binding protein (PBP1-ABC) superfamily)